MSAATSFLLYACVCGRDGLRPPTPLGGFSAQPGPVQCADVEHGQAEDQADDDRRHHHPDGKTGDGGQDIQRRPGLVLVEVGYIGHRLDEFAALLADVDRLEEVLRKAAGLVERLVERIAGGDFRVDPLDAVDVPCVARALKAQFQRPPQFHARIHRLRHHPGQPGQGHVCKAGPILGIRSMNRCNGRVHNRPRTTAWITKASAMPTMMMNVGILDQPVGADEPQPQRIDGRLGSGR